MVDVYVYLLSYEGISNSLNFRLQKAQTELVIKKNQCLNLGIDVDG